MEWFDVCEISEWFGVRRIGLPAVWESRVRPSPDAQERWEVRGAWTPSGRGVQGQYQGRCAAKMGDAGGLDSQRAGSPGQMCGKDGTCAGKMANVRERCRPGGMCTKDRENAGRIWGPILKIYQRNLVMPKAHNTPGDPSYLGVGGFVMFLKKTFLNARVFFKET